jgi:hypothetical protein
MERWKSFEIDYIKGLAWHYQADRQKYRQLEENYRMAHKKPDT